MLRGICVAITRNRCVAEAKIKLPLKEHFPNFRTSSSLYRKTKYGGHFTVTVVPGDGFDSHHMTYVKDIFQCANVPVNFEEVLMDPTKQSEDNMNEVIASIERNGVAIKGNICAKRNNFNTQSRNVILRKKLDLFANILHCKSQPDILTKHKDIDLILVRQNTEGEYSNLEHEIAPGVVENIKITTKEKSEEITRFAFQYAIQKNRKKITTFHKSNVMPLTDGLFLSVCKDIAKEYPSIEFDTMLIDTGCKMFVMKPQQFDVLLLTNLYGNVMNNVACGLIGGSGIVSGQNYGHDCAVFEVGTRSSEILDNPVSMIYASIELLHYLGLETYAKIIEDSVCKTLYVNRVLTHDLGGTAESADVVSHVTKNILWSKTFR